MEERFMRPPEPKGPSRLAGIGAAVRYFLTLAAATTAIAAALGLVVGTATGHGALKSLVYGLWIGGGILLVLGGAGGPARGGVAARQTPGRRLLPGQMDPVALILIGAVPVGIGILIAVLTSTY